MDRPSLEALYRDAVASLSGERLALDALSQRTAELVPAEGGRRLIFALGKAACGMARAAGSLGAVSGVAVAAFPGAVPSGVSVVQGGHPLPDERSVRGGEALLTLAAASRPEDVALFLISGGGSALAAAPAPGVSLSDKVKTTRALLRSGAPIEEINAVRRHLSALKGGQLAASCSAGRRLALILGDIPSGDAALVSSGPTHPDPTSFEDALDILRRRNVGVPAAVSAWLALGAAGQLAETPKPGDARLSSVEHVLLAAPRDLAVTAGKLAEQRGMTASVEERPLTGDVNEAVERIASVIAAGRGHRLLILWGEPTVKLPPSAGRGGRMQQLALLLAQRLEGTRFEALCAGSDGRDGDSDHAGARVDGETAARARSAEIDLAAAISRCDSAAATSKLGLALPAFDSGTNLCDLVLIRLEAS